MKVGSRFRRYWLFAFALPFFRLRYVFATPSDRLRDRSGKALGLSNLRSDSPLHSVHIGCSYLHFIGASSGSGTLGLLSVSNVALANGVLGLLFDTDSSEHSSTQALFLDRIVHSRPERWGYQLSTMSGSTTVPVPSAYARAVCFWNVQCDSNRIGTISHTSEMTEKEINYVAKSRSNSI
jgi:hypothetical protein